MSYAFSIAGGGIGDGVLAQLLARGGKRVAVIERSVAPVIAALRRVARPIRRLERGGAQPSLVWRRRRTPRSSGVLHPGGRHGDVPAQGDAGCEGNPIPLPLDRP